MTTAMELGPWTCCGGLQGQLKEASTTVFGFVLSPLPNTHKAYRSSLQSHCSIFTFVLFFSLYFLNLLLSFSFIRSSSSSNNYLIRLLRLRNYLFLITMK